MLKVDYNQLEFWKESYSLSLEIYKVEFPKSETFGLQSQARRCSTSVSLNIAEGSGRSTLKDFKSFLHIALGSCKELEVILKLCKDLNYISLDTHSQLTKKLDKVIGSLHRYIKKLE